MPSLPPRGDAVALTAALVRIDSRNPTLVPGAPGEKEAADFLAATLESWGMIAEVVEAAPGRHNVVATIGDGPRSLIFNGHLDVVGTEGMSHTPFDPVTKNGRMFGRGSADMKGGVAAMCAAAVRVGDEGVPVRITIAAVCDEEYESLGTRAFLDSGARADAAIITEPTSLAIAPAHRGFVWLDIDFTGVASHGSRYDIGVDAITHAGLVLAELDRFHRETLMTRTHPLLGRASVHGSMISGGTGYSTYPDFCRLSVERRTLPGETREQAVAEIQAACDRVAASTKGFNATITVKTAQDPSDVAVDSPVVRALSSALEGEKLPVKIEGFTAWTDAALFNAVGIPAVCFGPGDIAFAHAAEEYVPINEIERATDVLARLVRLWAAQ